MAMNECDLDIEQLVMNLTMPEVVTRLPPSEHPPSGQPERKKKMRTREKIEKLVAEGQKNYPAYLKLVHTGDSDFSDNEEMERIAKTRQNREQSYARTQENMDNKVEKTESEKPLEIKTAPEEGKKRKWSFKKKWMKLSPGTPGEEKKDPVKDTPTSEKGSGWSHYLWLNIALFMSSFWWFRLWRHTWFHSHKNLNIPCVITLIKSNE